jgi:hypothetical protein
MLTIAEIRSVFDARWKGVESEPDDEFWGNLDDVMCETQEDLINDLETWVNAGKPDLSDFYFFVSNSPQINPKYKKRPEMP